MVYSRASYRNSGAQLVFIFEAAAAFGCFGTRVIPYGHAFYLLRVRSCVCGAVVVRGILSAIDRSDMRRVPAEIWAPNPELLPLRINPFPELFGGSPSLVAGSALDTHDIGRKPMPVAPAGAPAVVRPIARRLEAACDGLAVVIPECTGDAGQRGAASAARSV